MIKDIEQASNSFSFTNNLILTEKMNMFYFKVIVTPISCNIISHNHKMITNIERVINDVWEEVFSFVDNEIEKKKEYITSKYGSVAIGFFYCPVEKPLSIKYEKFFNTDIKNNKFIISNIKRLDTKKYVDISDFCTDIKLLNIRGMGGGPKILYPNSFLSILNSFIHKDTTKEELIKYLQKNMTTFSGNDFTDIEGLVFSERGKTYQMIIKDVIDRKEYDRKEYECIIKDFISFWYNKKDNKLEKEYTKNINKLFLEYVNSTNIFINNIFNQEKLIPPGNNYIGELNYKLIKNDTIKTICRVNSIYKNVYRILYKGLKQYKKYNTHLVYLTEEDIKKWNNIVDIIWYKKSEE